MNYGEVSRSHAAVSVSGGDNPDALVGWYYSEVGHGGLVGWYYGQVSNSYATGSVSGGDNLGGLVGYNDRGEIHHSYATGSVSGGDSIGGLAGYNVGFITASYATGSVSGDSYAGGLAGSNQSIIQATYATGSVTGKNSPGGLVGLNESGISHSYAIGRVVAGDGAPGGFIGENNHGNPGPYNTDINATGIGKGIAVTQWGSPVAQGKTTAELQSPTGYTGIYDGWENDDDFWHFGAGSQYPALKTDLNGGWRGDLAGVRPPGPSGARPAGGNHPSASCGYAGAVAQREIRRHGGRQPQLDHLPGQQTQGPVVMPFRGWAAGQGNQVGLAPVVQVPGPVGLGTVLQNPLQPFFGKALLDPVHRAQGHIQSFGHLGRRPTVVALQQNPHSSGHSG